MSASCHLGGGASCEGEEEDAGGVDVGVDEVGDAVGEGVGFSGACAGDDEEGRVERRGGGGALLGVEGVEEGRVHAFNSRSVSVGCCNAQGKKCKRRTNSPDRYIEGHD